MPRDRSRGALSPFENVENLAQVALDRRDRLQLECRSRDSTDLPLATMLLDLLPRAFDRVLLGVEQVLHELNELDLPTLIDAIAGTVLRRTQELELTFPVSQ